MVVLDVYEYRDVHSHKSTRVIALVLAPLTHNTKQRRLNTSNTFTPTCAREIEDTDDILFFGPGRKGRRVIEILEFGKQHLPTPVYACMLIMHVRVLDILLLSSLQKQRTHDKTLHPCPCHSVSAAKRGCSISNNETRLRRTMFCLLFARV
jgi:hypothetical protein